MTAGGHFFSLETTKKNKETLLTSAEKEEPGELPIPFNWSKSDQLPVDNMNLVRKKSSKIKVCVCVSQWKKVPDEWQARQATPAILQVSSSKHNAKKITARERGPFYQSITAILTEEKREEKQFTKPTHVAVYLFRELDRDRSRL